MENFLIFMNKLYDLMDRGFSETHILTYLQEYGFISDNCYRIFHVCNDYEAYDYLMGKYNKFKEAKWAY